MTSVTIARFPGFPNQNFDAGAFCSAGSAAWSLIRRLSVFLSATVGPAPTAVRRPDAATAARFEQFILPHLDAAHNLARFLSRDADAAQDIVQEAFLRAFRSFAEFRGGSARSWLLAIVRNCHYDWRSGRKRDAVLAPPDEVNLDELAGDEDTPETTLLRRLEAESVRAILDGIPELFREVLVLRELEDLTYREIAEVTAVPIGTVMSRLARARKLFAVVWQGRAPSSDPGR
ncbi:MAG: sigma-70 family RNA polymerase sigma factor [Azospirillaceae bacterium]|nr:sigma-70 family RNA polymerase sigma factor [Azospirillaceae bacterium]